MKCPTCGDGPIVEMAGSKAGKLHCTHCGYEWKRKQSRRPPYPPASPATLDALDQLLNRPLTPEEQYRADHWLDDQSR